MSQDVGDIVHSVSSYLLLKPGEYNSRNLQRKDNSLELLDPYTKGGLPQSFSFDKIYQPTQHYKFYEQLSEQVLRHSAPHTVVLLGQGSQSKLSSVMTPGSIENFIAGKIERNIQRSAIISKIAAGLIAGAKKNACTLSLGVLLDGKELLDLLAEDLDQPLESFSVRSLSSQPFNTELKLNSYISAGNTKLNELRSKEVGSKYNVVVVLRGPGGEGCKVVNFIDCTSLQGDKGNAKDEKEFSDRKIKSVVESYVSKLLGETLTLYSQRLVSEVPFFSTLINLRGRLSLVNILNPSEYYYQDSLRSLQFIERCIRPLVAEDKRKKEWSQDSQIKEVTSVTLIATLTHINQRCIQTLNSLSRQYSRKLSTLCAVIGVDRIRSVSQLPNLEVMRQKYQDIQKLTQSNLALTARLEAIKADRDDAIQGFNHRRQLMTCDLIRTRLAIESARKKLGLVQASFEAKQDYLALSRERLKRRAQLSSAAINRSKIRLVRSLESINQSIQSAARQNKPSRPEAAQVLQLQNSYEQWSSLCSRKYAQRLATSTGQQKALQSQFLKQSNQLAKKQERLRHRLLQLFFVQLKKSRKGEFKTVLQEQYPQLYAAAKNELRRAIGQAGELAKALKDRLGQQSIEEPLDLYKLPELDRLRQWVKQASLRLKFLLQQQK